MERPASKGVAAVGLGGIDAAGFTGAEDIAAATIFGGECPSVKVEPKALGVNGRAVVVIVAAAGATVSGVAEGEQPVRKARRTGSEADIVEAKGIMSG